MSLDEFAIHGLFPNFYDGTRVSYCYDSLLSAMAAPGVRVERYVLGNFSAAGSHIHSLLPRLLYGRTSRLLPRPATALASRFERRFGAGDVAYFWLGNPAWMCRRLQRRGVVVVREMVNCTLVRCNEELRRAHDQLGLPFSLAASDEAIAEERADLLAADAVFCPNECVLESVRDYGVPVERCIATSYGWSRQRLAGEKRLFSAASGTTFLFAGSGNIRKGLPWLLQAWAAAGIDGHLLLAGTVDSAVRATHGEILARDDIVELGHVADIGDAYRSADVFCFATWEEGGPMVTIEAMGMGLPCIVTRMGAAGILSARRGGAIMVEPGDSAGLASAMRRLAGDAALRAQLGAANVGLANDYLWERVGARRLEALKLLRDRVRSTTRPAT